MKLKLQKWMRLHILRIPVDSRMRLFYLLNYNTSRKVNLKYEN